MCDNLIILEKKLNLFNKNYAIYKSQNSINDIELKECLFDVLSWIEVCLLKKLSKIDSIEKEKISAIKYANNMKKHSTSLYTHTLHSYALYPSKNLYPSANLYPSNFNIYWNTLPLDNLDFKPQYDMYNKHLKDKNVYDTINEIYTIIRKNYI